jgi:hypothetical protein
LGGVRVFVSGALQSSLLLGKGEATSGTMVTGDGGLGPEIYDTSQIPEPYFSDAGNHSRKLQYLRCNHDQINPVIGSLDCILL